MVQDPRSLTGSLADPGGISEKQQKVISEDTVGNCSLHFFLPLLHSDPHGYALLLDAIPSSRGLKILILHHAALPETLHESTICSIASHVLATLTSKNFSQQIRHLWRISKLIQPYIALASFIYNTFSERKL